MAHPPRRARTSFSGVPRAARRRPGPRDRREPLRAYVTGLCLPGERKSIEPMAARIDPRHVRARHQSMHHFVANAPWETPRCSGSRATGCWRRWSGTGRWPRGSSMTPGSPRRARTRWAWPVSTAACLGKQDELSGGGERLGGERGGERAGGVSTVSARELGEGSAATPGRRGSRRPSTFRPKWQIALGQILAVQAEGVPPAPVVADAGYGVSTEFRDALTARPALRGRRDEETRCGPRASRPGRPAVAAGGPPTARCGAPPAIARPPSSPGGRLPARPGRR